MTRPAIESVKRHVADCLGVMPSELTSRRRTGIAEARMIAVHLACTLTACSLTEVGRAFHRDHTTVLYLHRTAQRRAESDAAFRQKLTDIRNAVVLDANPPSAQQELAKRLVLDLAAAFRAAALTLAAQDPGAVINMFGPVCARMGISIPEELKP
jgi:hypothetical protein